MDYISIAKKIIEKTGGRKNIIKTTHCAVRLRFVVADKTKYRKDEIEKIEGVGGVFEASGQLQIVFGDAVNNIYKAVAAILEDEDKAIEIQCLDDIKNNEESADRVSDIKNDVQIDKMEDRADGLMIYSPLEGEAVSLSEVPDFAFSNEILGKGMAIIPHSGKIVSPVDGEVVSLFDVLHAVGIRGDNGVEILIHMGINTVELNGRFYKAFVKEGDKIKKGQQIFEADIEGIRNAGYNTITPVIITNSDEYESVEQLITGNVGRSEPVMLVKRK